MGLYVSGNIFQKKVNELLGDIQGVKEYINNILVLNNGPFEDHVQKLPEIFKRFQKAGLKVNANKYSFGVKDIPYLGYIITQDWFKPDPKKGQGIMDLERPKTTTEVQSLLGTVQYYRDMWKSCSHILEPLTTDSSGIKGAKIIWNDYLEQAFNDMNKMIWDETIFN